MLLILKGFFKNLFLWTDVLIPTGFSVLWAMHCAWGQGLEFVMPFRVVFFSSSPASPLDATYLTRMLLGYKIKLLGDALKHTRLLCDRWSWFGVPSNWRVAVSLGWLFSPAKSRFLNLDTGDTWDQLIFFLCVWVCVCPMHRGIFSIFLGFYLVDASSIIPNGTIKISPKFTKCPSGAKLHPHPHREPLIVKLQEVRCPQPCAGCPGVLRSYRAFHVYFPLQQLLI